MAYPALATLLTTEQQQLRQHLVTLAAQLPGTTYASMSDDQRQQMATAIIENVIAHFAGTQPIEVFGQRMTRLRVHDPAYSPESIQGIITVIATSLFCHRGHGLSGRPPGA